MIKYYKIFYYSYYNTTILLIMIDSLENLIKKTLPSDINEFFIKIKDLPYTIQRQISSIKFSEGIIFNSSNEINIFIDNDLADIILIVHYDFYEPIELLSNFINLQSITFNYNFNQSLEPLSNLINLQHINNQSLDYNFIRKRIGIYRKELINKVLNKILYAC